VNVTRTLEVPSVRTATLQRLGRVTKIEPHPESPDSRRITLEPLVGFRPLPDGDRNAWVSVDTGGDDMRSGQALARLGPYQSKATVFWLFCAPVALAEGDWLWVEA
jgi:hypothetical protein